MNRLNVRMGWIAMTAIMSLTQADIIASYDFSVDLAANTVIANVTANAFTEGTSFAGSADAGRSGSGQNLFARASLTAGGGSGSLDGAIAAGDYFSFVIDVDPGSSMDLSALTLNAGYTSAGAQFLPKTLTASLLTSVDGFNSGNLVDDIASFVTTQESSPQYQAWNIDLSGEQFQGLAGSVEFRIHLHDETSNSGYIHRIDDVVLNGSVSAIPEPGTTGLLGLGLLMIARLCRKNTV